MEDSQAHKAHQAIYEGWSKKRGRSLLSRQLGDTPPDSIHITVANKPIAIDDPNDVLAAGKRVAEQIRELEAKLARVPFRVDCEVWHKDRTHGLGFYRAGDGWALHHLSRWFEEEEPPRLTKVEEIYLKSMQGHVLRQIEKTDRLMLKDVSLVKKAQSIRLASELIAQMRLVHASRLREFSEARASIDKAMLLLDTIEKEGA